MPTDVQRIQAVFLAAAEIGDPADRAKFLDETCDGDAELRSRVEALLRAHDQPDSLLDHPAAAAPDPDPGATEALNGAPDPGAPAPRTAAGGNGSSDDEALAFLAPPNRPDSLGRIGHYEVLQILGKGGFGIVFRAFDETLQRVVALKVLAPQLAATSPARKRFLREARSSAQVRHENVVQVYEVAEQPLPYLAMEFIPGETLQQRLDRVGPVEPAEVVRIGRQIAEGLAAAHATDLIHRDIKPGNVLLEGGQHKVKITDFGLARAADDASLSQSGIIAGTPMYMAPEQAQGQTLDQRADLFSLGSVLYQMASGRPPFRANSTVAVLKRVAEDRPRPIREIIPETPQWLCDIIAKLHAKNPDDRYQSAREVADVLADCEAQLKANARLKDYSRIPRSKPQRSGRRKWGAATAAVVLLPVIALVVLELAGVTHLFRWGPPKQDTEQPKPAADASFDAKEAQEASARQLGVPVETTNSIGMKLRLIPAGKFMMGSSKEEIDYWLKRSGNDWVNEKLLSEGPQHEVELTQPFCVGQSDVTVGQFRQFVMATGYQTEPGASHFGEFDANKNWQNPGFAQTEDHPVVCVSWNDAVEFCNWLSKKEGKTYRLPTEAEWEYSCRAGSKGRWSFGDNEGELLDYARFLSNSQGHTWPVAGLKENAWGLYDMHGNVFEWCQDVYDATYYKTSPPKDPPGPDAGAERVQRGGSWAFNPGQCRSAFRVRNTPGARCDDAGFRVVLAISPPAGVPTESGAKAAKEAQEASARQLGVPVETTNSIGMKLRLIPAGKFMMGSPKEEIDTWLKVKQDGWYKELLLSEGPQHEVEITQPFYLGQTDVTVGQFRQFVKATGYKTQAEREGSAVRGLPDGGFKEVADTSWLNPGYAQTDDHPVVCVSWNDAVEFCQWMSKEEGRTYRLPTEAEWEYSCRAGSKGRWSFGDNEGELWDYARVGGNSQGHTWPVAGLKANAWGLYDMHGNVEQCCQDLFDPNYYKTSPPKDPPGPAAGDERVARGGFWLWNDAWWSRSAMRHKHNPAGRANFIGFRVVLVVSPPAGVPTESGAKDAKEAQEASAKQLGVPVETTNSIGMKLRLIPPGKFTMGSSQEEIDRCLKPFAEGAWQRQFLLSEGPEHEVEITQPFYMGATHVTVRQFRQFVEEETYPADVRWKNPGFEQTDNNPVVFVSWQNAVDFCNWLSKKEGKQYRLPTEAEWEYCCRAGKSGTRYCFGDDEAQLENYAWYAKNSDGGTHPVGKKKPNDWGLYDMHGNAWEWCHDYGDFRYYERSPAKDPMGPGAGGDHVTRGGSWNCVPVQCRSALRGRMRTCSELGFRVLLVSPPGGVRTGSGVKDKPAPPAVAPFTDADVQRIAALPAEQQVEEVRKELKRRNPGFDGKMGTKIEGGVVTELRIVTDKVTDIAPIRVFDALRQTFGDKAF